MSNFKRFPFLIFICILTFSLVFSGCFRKEQDEGITRYNGVELTYYKVFDGSDVMEPLINKFEATHPGLVIHYKKFDDFEEYQRVILNEMAEGEGPDIFSMQNTWFMSNYKKITPMPSDIGTPDLFEGLFVDVAYKDLVRTDDEGHEQIYGVPMTVDTLALYYNKDHFEDRLPSKGKPSDTWEGIKEDVFVLNKTDESFDRFEISGIAMGRADNISRAVDILYLLFLQHDTQIYDDLMTEAVFAARQNGLFSYPGMEALDLYSGFADEDNKHFSWNEYTADDDSEGQEIEAFARGDVSMIIGYSYTYDLIENYIRLVESKKQTAIDKDAIRIASIPQLYDPDVSNEKRVTYASYFAETVSRNTENPELAWDLLVFLTQGEQLDSYFNETHKPTSRRDMIEDQKDDPIYGVFAEQIGFAESFPIVDYYTYKDAFERVIDASSGSGIAQGALIDAQDHINEFLPKDGIIVPVAKETEEEESEE